MKLRAGVLSILVTLLGVPVIHAQEGGDQWFVLDKFSGLNFFAEKTSLEPWESAIAKNIQFQKENTISVLDGLRIRDTICAGSFPVIGIGNLKRWDVSESRLFAACSSLIWVTPANSWQFAKASARLSPGDSCVWERDPDSAWLHSVYDTSFMAERLRAGWIIKHDTDSLDTISWIASNAVLFLKSNPYTPDTTLGGKHQQRYHGKIYIPLASSTAPVQFVPLDVGDNSSMLCLQAGMEPILYKHADSGGFQYFGVADTGRVGRIGIDPVSADSSVLFISDNSKINIYGRNELRDKGYWLHLPPRRSGATDVTLAKDSSRWGCVWQIDSNVVDTSGDTSEFRIYVRPGMSKQDLPKAGNLLSSYYTRYQLLSAPFLRTTYSEQSTPTGKVRNGARTIQIPTGTIAAHEFDNRPHLIEFTDDSLRYIVPYYQITCGATKCETTLAGYNRGTPSSLNRGRAYPIRTTFVDTAATPDSIIIWTSGTNLCTAWASFTTSGYQIYNATIPYASKGIVYKDRLYLAGDPQDPNFICYSEPFKMSAFPVGNALRLASNGDKFVGFANLYDWLVIFQEFNTWLLKDDPDNGGTLELALPGEGCIAAKTIIPVDNQVMYLASRGWRIFDGNTSRDFAINIRPSIQGYPRLSYIVNQGKKSVSASAFDPSSGNVWMSMPFSTSTTNNGSFLYNNSSASFSYSDEVYGGNVTNLYYMDTSWMTFTNPSNARIYTYGYTDSITPVGVDGDSMNARWESGWLDFGAPEQLKYVEDGAFYVTASAPTAGPNRKLYVSFYKDMDTTAFYADTANVVGYITGVYYVANNQFRLEPMSEFQWLKIRVDTYGYSVADFQRLVLRWRPGADIVRDRSTVFRP